MSAYHVKVTIGEHPAENWPCFTLDEARSIKAGRVGEYQREAVHKTMFDPPVDIYIEDEHGNRIDCDGAS